LGRVWFEARESGLGLRFKFAVLLLGGIFLVSCEDNSYAIERSLAGANGGDPKYRDTLVKVCGFATNEFETSQISEFKSDNPLEMGERLAVVWLKSEAQTEGAKKRCIFGLLEPMCGWDEYESPDLICESTDSRYEWKIRQTS